jgi:sigma-B regulation protein RsbQ
VVVSILARNNVHLGGSPTGTPMVFAHGFGCDQSMWRYVAPAFADRFRTVMFDHVGFGSSDLSAWNRTRYASLRGYAEDVLEIIGELGLSDVIFVGHSVAAMIGVLAVGIEPDRFGHLVLVGPSPRYIDDPRDGYVGGFSQADIDELLETLDSNYLGWSRQMAPVIVGNPDRPELGQELTNAFCRTDPEVAKLFARVTFLSDNRRDLDRVRTPTLTLQCRDDPIAPEPVGEYVHRHIRGSRLVYLDASGHCPNLSAPDQTVHAIHAYLAGVPSRSAVE